MHRIAKLIYVLLACSFLAAAQKPASGTPAQIIVSLGHSFGQAPILSAGDVTITERFGDPLPITALTPLRDGRGAMELCVLVDNCSTCEPGTKFEELRRFIQSQPQTTAVGIAYIQDGRLKVAEKPSADRKRAVNALAAPAGGQPGNPFQPLAELIETWPPSAARHVVLMISSGFDPGGSDQADPAAEAAIAAAQRAGVTIYAVYHPSADYLNADFSKLNWGQVQLAHIANETGGEAYFLSFGPLPSLAPFLADIAQHLANRYLLEFLASPAKGSGELREIEVKSKNPDVELMAPAKAWVPGGGAPTTGSR